MTEYGIRRSDESKEMRIAGLCLRAPFSTLFNPILSQTLKGCTRRVVLAGVGWVERSATHRRGPQSGGFSCASTHPTLAFSYTL